VVDGWNGLYVAPGDSADLRTKIRYLLDNPAEAQRMGANGRTRVEERFTLDHYIERLHNAVDSLAKPPQLPIRSDASQL
jgi:glycosyltransferase involved in cell wall biosynthesis